MLATSASPLENFNPAVQQQYFYMLEQYGDQAANNYLAVASNSNVTKRGLPKPRIDPWYKKRHKQRQDEQQQETDELWHQRLIAALPPGQWFSYRQISDLVKDKEGKHPNPAELRKCVGRLARIGWIKSTRGAYKKFSLPKPFEIGDRVVEFFGHPQLERHGQIIRFCKLAQADGIKVPVIKFDNGLEHLSNPESLIHEIQS